MLHELTGERYSCEFADASPDYGRDYVIAVRGEEILLTEGDGAELPPASALMGKESRYLFSISGRGFFLADIDALDGCRYVSTQALRTLKPKWMAFAAVTGYHLAYWYSHNRFCGACAAPMRPSDNERALVCERCGGVVYPNIAVAVIVGVKDGDSLLLTRYSARAYKRFALVAGYAEIGEGLEDTVRREVYEETRLKVKNISYYGNQPWGFSRSLLVGFFADLDGTNEFHLDDGELSMAVWMRRDEIPEPETDISLTSEMMHAFKTGAVR